MTTNSVHPSKPVRVRLAPSPTGALHVGTLRTAIYNWVLARQTGGQFLLRIEDTDQERLVPGSIEQIQESLRWLGLEWDEGPGKDGPHGPYIQSERLQIYQAATKRLLDSSLAYECDCSPERLTMLRERQKAQGLPPGYDNRCRSRPGEELRESRERGVPIVVRLKSPGHGDVTFRDAVRGDITFDSSKIQDFVIMKSDGFPTYHLAHVVDDHEMRITHVLRGDEWIPTSPLHVLIHRALGYEVPVYVHLPLLLGKDKTKLSKRHGAASALEYRDLGYLPDAVFNFLALLGWSPGEDIEIMSREEIVRRFTLDRVNDSPAVFDSEKLEWMNGVYIRQMPLDALTDDIMPWLEKAITPPWNRVQRPIDRTRVRALIPMIQERLKRLAEAPDLLAIFFEEEVMPDRNSIIQKGMDVAATTKALTEAHALAKSTQPFEPEPLEIVFRALAEQLGIKPGQLFGSIRVAITARSVAPPLFHTMSGLGRDRVITRLDKAIRTLESAP
ncbi:MAG: glutamate--tRNA ligase [Dehalococcoidia bacterium]|nr:glutamate--tRNA ligase [Dehalococcoidia bacterium]